MIYDSQKVALDADHFAAFIFPRNLDVVVSEFKCRWNVANQDVSLDSCNLNGNGNGITETARQLNSDVGSQIHIEVDESLKLLRYVHLPHLDVKLEAISLHNFINHILIHIINNSAKIGRIFSTYLLSINFWALNQALPSEELALAAALSSLALAVGMIDTITEEVSRLHILIYQFCLLESLEEWAVHNHQVALLRR